MSAMRNHLFTLQYDGRQFCGWQRQRNGISVQQCFEEALAKIVKHDCHATGAGRTDAGVHAHGQAANVKLRTAMTPAQLRRALNVTLPETVRVARVRVVPDDFHARYSAIEKTYRYLVQSGAVRSPFMPFYVTWTPYEPDIELMRRAARHCLGRHDFAAFMASGSSVKTTVRTVRELTVKRGGGLTSFTITADGFLRHMVRNIVGTLLAVGIGRIAPEALPGIIAGGDRSGAGPTAPAEGLTLLRVVYPNA